MPPFPALLLVAAVLAAGVVWTRIYRTRQRALRVGEINAAWFRTGNDDEGLLRSASQSWRAREDGASRDVIDPRTWDDLSMEEVVVAIDRTSTHLGLQTLYRKLRMATPWEESPAMYSAALAWSASSDARADLAGAFAECDRSLGNGLWSIATLSQWQTTTLHRVAPALTLVLVASIVAIVFSPLFAVLTVVLAFGNTFVRSALGHDTTRMLVAARQFEQLFAVAKSLSAIEVVDADQRMRAAEALKALARLRRACRWLSADAAPLGEMAAIIREYRDSLLLVEVNALRTIAREVTRHQPALLTLADFVGSVDMGVSVAAESAASDGWCTPDAFADESLVAHGVWHPIVQSPVGNDVDLRPGEGELIAGPNMSGKTTYIRAVGVASLLARVLNQCPAQSWSGPRVIPVSFINREDSLVDGKSYFRIEADRAIELLSQADDSSPRLFLLDEPLRGTNRREASALTLALLDALVRDELGVARPHMLLACTHDEDVWKHAPRFIRLTSFRGTVASSVVTFDYVRRHGAVANGMAIAILEQLGAAPWVINRARGAYDWLEGER